MITLQQAELILLFLGIMSLFLLLSWLNDAINKAGRTACRTGEDQYISVLGRPIMRVQPPRVQ